MIRRAPLHKPSFFTEWARAQLGLSSVPSNSSGRAEEGALKSAMKRGIAVLPIRMSERKLADIADAEETLQRSNEMKGR